MNKVAQMPARDRADLFMETAERKVLPEAIIEKDFWVCWMLKQLFSIEALSGRLLFKGGTSLSKIFHAINRFSEDIDLAVDYEAISAEDLAARSPGAYDVVTCLELLEHVPDPASTVRACAQLARPGGHVFFSTINRNAKAYALAIVGAEYVLGLLPRGTHDYARFLKPSEIAAFARAAGLETEALIGMTYNPFTKAYRLESDASVNYIMTFRRDQ